MTVKKEAVRLPGRVVILMQVLSQMMMSIVHSSGMISMEPEEEGERLRSLRMNVPLQIFVDTSESSGGKARGRVSPGLRGSLARSESVEA